MPIAKFNVPADGQKYGWEQQNSGKELYVVQTPGNKLYFSPTPKDFDDASVPADATLATERHFNLPTADRMGKANTSRPVWVESSYSQLAGMKGKSPAEKRKVIASWQSLSGNAEANRQRIIDTKPVKEYTGNVPRWFHDASVSSSEGLAQQYLSLNKGIETLGLDATLVPSLINDRGQDVSLDEMRHYVTPKSITDMSIPEALISQGVQTLPYVLGGMAGKAVPAVLGGIQGLGEGEYAYEDIRDMRLAQGLEAPSTAQRVASDVGYAALNAAEGYVDSLTGRLGTRLGGKLLPKRAMESAILRGGTAVVGDALMEGATEVVQDVGQNVLSRFVLGDTEQEIFNAEDMLASGLAGAAGALPFAPISYSQGARDGRVAYMQRQTEWMRSRMANMPLVAGVQIPIEPTDKWIADYVRSMATTAGYSPLPYVTDQGILGQTMHKDRVLAYTSPRTGVHEGTHAYWGDPRLPDDDPAVPPTRAKIKAFLAAHPEVAAAWDRVGMAIVRTHDADIIIKRLEASGAIDPVVAKAFSWKSLDGLRTLAQSNGPYAAQAQTLLDIVTNKDPVGRAQQLIQQTPGVFKDAKLDMKSEVKKYEGPGESFAYLVQLGVLGDPTSSAIMKSIVEQSGSSTRRALQDLLYRLSGSRLAQATGIGRQYRTKAKAQREAEFQQILDTIPADRMLAKADEFLQGYAPEFAGDPLAQAAVGGQQSALLPAAPPSLKETSPQTYDQILELAMQASEALRSGVHPQQVWEQAGMALPPWFTLTGDEHIDPRLLKIETEDFYGANTLQLPPHSYVHANTSAQNPELTSMLGDLYSSNVLGLWYPDYGDISVNVGLAQPTPEGITSGQYDPTERRLSTYLYGPREAAMLRGSLEHADEFAGDSGAFMAYVLDQMSPAKISELRQWAEEYQNKTVAHEMQHAIQTAMGPYEVTGQSPASAPAVRIEKTKKEGEPAAKLVNAVNRKANAWLAKHPGKTLADYSNSSNAAMQGLIKSIEARRKLYEVRAAERHEGYKRSAGEIEADEAMNRSQHGKAWRKRNRPYAGSNPAAITEFHNRLPMMDEHGNLRPPLKKPWRHPTEPLLDLTQMRHGEYANTFEAGMEQLRPDAEEWLKAYARGVYGDDRTWFVEKSWEQSRDELIAQLGGQQSSVTPPKTLEPTGDQPEVFPKIASRMDRRGYNEHFPEGIPPTTVTNPDLLYAYRRWWPWSNANLEREFGRHLTAEQRYEAAIQAKADLEKNEASFSPEKGNAYAYINAIARNAARNLLKIAGAAKRGKHVRHVSASAAPEQGESPLSDRLAAKPAASDKLSMDMQEVVDQAIQNLTKNPRTAKRTAQMLLDIVKAEMGSGPVNELAGKYGVDPKALYFHRTRLLAEMRKILGGEPKDEGVEAEEDEGQQSSVKMLPDTPLLPDIDLDPILKQAWQDFYHSSDALLRSISPGSSEIERYGAISRVAMEGLPKVQNAIDSGKKVSNLFDLFGKMLAKEVVRKDQEPPTLAEVDEADEPEAELEIGDELKPGQGKGGRWVAPELPAEVTANSRSLGAFVEKVAHRMARDPKLGGISFPLAKKIAVRLSRGMSPTQIARQLSLSPQSVVDAGTQYKRVVSAILAAGGEKDVVQQEDVEEVAKLVYSRLPQHHRAMLKAYAEGKGYTGAGQVAGLGNAAVRSAMYNLRNRMADELVAAPSELGSDRVLLTRAGLATPEIGALLGLPKYHVDTLRKWADGTLGPTSRREAGKKVPTPAAKAYRQAFNAYQVALRAHLGRDPSTAETNRAIYTAMAKAPASANWTKKKQAEGQQSALRPFNALYRGQELPESNMEDALKVIDNSMSDEDHLRMAAAQVIREMREVGKGYKPENPYAGDKKGKGKIYGPMMFRRARYNRMQKAKYWVDKFSEKKGPNSPEALHWKRRVEALKKVSLKDFEFQPEPMEAYGEQQSSLRDGSKPQVFEDEFIGKGKIRDSYYDHPFVVTKDGPDRYTIIVDWKTDEGQQEYSMTRDGVRGPDGKYRFNRIDAVSPAAEGTIDAQIALQNRLSPFADIYQEVFEDDTQLDSLMMLDHDNTFKPTYAVMDGDWYPYKGGEEIPHGGVWGDVPLNFRTKARALQALKEGKWDWDELRSKHLDALEKQMLKGQEIDWRPTESLPEDYYATGDDQQSSIKGLNYLGIAPDPRPEALELAKALEALRFEDFDFSPEVPAEAQQSSLRPLGIAQPGDSFTLGGESWVSGFLRKLQDEFNPIKRMQRDVAKQGGRVNEGNDVYTRLRLMGKKIAAAIGLVDADYVNPIKKLAADAKLKVIDKGDGTIDLGGENIPTVDDYLTAKHADERNKFIQKHRDVNNPAGSGMEAGPGSEAENIIAAVEASPYAQVYRQIAEKVWEMNRNTLQRMRQGRLISQKMYDTLSKRFQWYVPLRSDMEADGIMPAGKGASVRNAGVKRMVGRTTRSDSPLTYSILQAQEKSIRLGKAEVGHALLRFVNANKDPELWTVNEWPLDKIQTKDDLGQPTTKIKPMPQLATPEDAVDVVLDGKRYLITFKGDAGKLIARGVKRMGLAQLGWTMRKLQWGARLFASLQTSFNPEFLFPNIIRDAQTAGFNMTAEQGKGYTWKVLKGAPRAFKAMWDVARDRNAKPGSEWHDAAREFLAAGGKLDTYALSSFEDVQKDLVRSLKDADPSLPRKGLLAAKAAVGVIERLNGAAETMLRLSAFKQARAMGMSPRKAAFLGSNLTVDFSAKGELGPIMNTLWVFSNASIQGNYRLAQAVMKSKTGKAMAASITLAGLASAMLMRGLFDEDEEERNYYDLIPENIRATHLVIPIKGGKDYVKWPLPYGLNALWNLGRLAGDTAIGKKTPGDASTQALAAFAESFSPIKGGKDYVKWPLPYGLNAMWNLGRLAGDTAIGKKAAGDASIQALAAFAESFSPISAEGSPLQAISPTILDPFIQSYENKDWLGQQIVPEQLPFGDQLPDSELARRSTPEFYRSVSRWLNDVTGGDYTTKGKVDISPSTIEHWVNWGIGGAGRFLRKTAALPGEIKEGTVSPSKIPLASRFIGEPQRRPNISSFYDIRQKTRDAYTNYQAYADRGDVGKAADYMQKRAKDITFDRWGAEMAQQASVLRKKSLLVKGKAREAIDDELNKLLGTYVRAYNTGKLPAYWRYQSDLSLLRAKEADKRLTQDEARELRRLEAPQNKLRGIPGYNSLPPERKREILERAIGGMGYKD